MTTEQHPKPPPEARLKTLHTYGPENLMVWQDQRSVMSRWAEISPGRWVNADAVRVVDSDAMAYAVRVRVAGVEAPMDFLTPDSRITPGEYAATIIEKLRSAQ